MYATTPQMHLKCTAAILCMYSIDIALVATMQSIDRLSAKYLDTLLLACLGHFMPTSVFMSQSILDFGLAPLKAKRAVVQHQKKRFEQEKDRAVLQLRSQTQLHLKRSQKKKTRLLQQQQTALQQTPTLHKPAQYTLNHVIICIPPLYLNVPALRIVPIARCLTYIIHTHRKSRGLQL